MKYRAEIDGLRALAVIPVILFHAGFDLFKGGFVGVDIFFVISGYLITTILIEDIEKDRFSITTFYERRARRILPALFAVVVISSVISLFLLEGKDLQRFGQSVVATSTFASNIYFWLKSGYFDVSSEFKPLLHTWSLAVEEQYYIFFPIFLIVAWNLGKRKVVLIISALAVISLALSEWGTRNAESANFYLIFSRAWELFAGSLAAFLVQKYGVRSNNFVSLLGIILILISIVIFDEKTPFPSLYTTLPIMGVVMLILCADQETFIAKILSTPILVGIGLISYSMYLWHQPILAFMRTHEHVNSLGLGLPLPHLSPAYVASALVLTPLLGYLSWLYVETPFRKKGVDPKKKYRWIYPATISLLIMLTFGSVIHFYYASVFKSSGINISSTWSRDVRQSKCLLQGDLQLIHSSECLKPDGTLLIGDSHAASLSIGMRSLLKQDDVNFSQLTQSGCGPILDLPNLVHRKTCNTINERILSDLRGSGFDRIVLHAAWLHEHYPVTLDQLESGFKAYLTELKDALPNSEIYVVGAIPRWRYGPENQTLPELHGQDILFMAGARLFTDVNERLASVVRSFDPETTKFVDPEKALCTPSSNAVECVIAVRNMQEQSYTYTYIDNGHLSRSGSLRLAKFLLAQSDL